MTLYCIATCTTCAMARTWLQAHGHRFTEFDLKSQVPSAQEMEEIVRRSGLELRKFFNTSGIKYRELGLSRQLPDMDPSEQLDMLLSDGMLMKRPLLIHNDKVLVGFDEHRWEKTL